MIKRLRRKFIAIAMCSVVVVLGIIMGVVNVANYYEINHHADAMLTILADNGGVFPKPEEMPHIQKLPPHEISPEAPFETRYFTVILRANQAVVSVNTGKIAAISTKTAAEYAVKLYSEDKTNGFQGDYKYRAISFDDGVMYIFLDCGRELSTFYSFLLISCFVALIGVFSVFVLVLFFSKWVTKPAVQSYEKQKRFITDASHEIKTPLAIIDANTEVLEMENGENEWTMSIKNQIKRLNLLTQKLVFLSRMDEEGTTIKMIEFSLSDAVIEMQQSFESVACAHEKSIHSTIEQPISYCGDESLIRQLISLLLDNAVKYSNENGQIYLSLKTIGKNKEITVTNTTNQIPQGKLDILFERFYRPDFSRNSGTGGHGIGLSVAKSIVMAHKGKISARSDDGYSIVFTVTL